VHCEISYCPQCTAKPYGCQGFCARFSAWLPRRQSDLSAFAHFGFRLSDCSLFDAGRRPASNPRAARPKMFPVPIGKACRTRPASSPATPGNPCKGLTALAGWCGRLVVSDELKKLIREADSASLPLRIKIRWGFSLLNGLTLFPREDQMPQGRQNGG
jgi:hypothetical protein